MAIFSLDIFNIYKESDKAYLSYLKPEDNSGLSKPSSSPEYFPSPNVLDSINKRSSKCPFKREDKWEKKKKKTKKSSS